jgi:LmbE family N-acetylglucosaminyl deacetylase
VATVESVPDDAALEPVPEDFDRCMAVVAHPDDLEYGCASVLAKWTSQGKSLVEVLATRGEAGIQGMAPEQAARVRSAEQEASAAVVGASAVEFLDHPDGMLEPSLALRRDLARAIRRHRPEVITTISFRGGFRGGGGWNHVDHRVLGTCLVDAVRDAANRWVFPELIDEGHEPWDGVRFVIAGGSPRAGHYVDVSDHVETALASLREHRAYLEALGDPEGTLSWLRGSMESVGQEVGVAAAVAVELI